MSSKIFKEGIIGILLTIVIIILLIIALYEYTPNQKTISEMENYTRTAETANALQEIATSDLANKGNESIIKSYSISSSDLSIYEKNASYDKGRANPFAEVDNEETTTNTTENTNTSAAGNKNNSNGSTTTNTSTGYFNTTGKNK